MGSSFSTAALSRTSACNDTRAIRVERRRVAGFSSVDAFSLLLDVSERLASGVRSCSGTSRFISSGVSCAGTSASAGVADADRRDVRPAISERGNGRKDDFPPLGKEIWGGETEIRGISRRISGVGRRRSAAAPLINLRRWGCLTRATSTPFRSRNVDTGRKPRRWIRAAGK